MGKLTKEMKETNRKEKLVKRINDNVERSRQHLGSWREMANSSYAMYGNDQWDTDDILQMKNMQKAPIVFNRVTRTVSAVMGVEATNRQAVMYYPRKTGDTAVSELLTGAANWVRESCNAEDEEVQAFRDTLICGIGWTETRLDYERDIDGLILIDRIDPMEMTYDINAKKDNLADMRWVCRIVRMTKDEVMETFPGQAEAILDEMQGGDFYDFGGNQGTPHDATKENAYRKGNDGYEANDTRNYNVLQYQWFELEDYWVTKGQGGEIIELSEIEEKLEQRKIKMKRRRYKQAFTIGSKLLLEDDIAVNDFTFRPITGLCNKRHNYWFGIVELMKDPQRWANKWLTEILYILRTNASGGICVEEGAFQNPQEALQNWAKPNSHIKMNPGGMAKIGLKPGMGQYPEGMNQLLQFAVSGIQDVTGVNVEMLGMADRNQPLGVEIQRKAAGTGILSPFFNALRRYHKEQGRVLAEYIINYISDGRLVRITGDQGAQYVPLEQKELAFKYDIIVDEAVSNPDIKEKTFSMMAPLILPMMQAGIPIPPDLFDYFPIPSSLAEKWKEMVTPKEATPEEMEQQQLQEMEDKIKEDFMIEQQAKLIDAESNYKNSQAMLNEAKISTEHASAQQKQMQTFNEASGTDELIKEERFLREQARYDVELELEERRKAIRAGIL
jgi:hypothetical protein